MGDRFGVAHRRSARIGTTKFLGFDQRVARSGGVARPPLSFFRNRTRVVANASTLIGSGGFFTYAFMLTLFEQQVLHYSPLKCGLTYLPFGFAIGTGIGLNNALMPKFGVRSVLALGMTGSAVGLFLTSRISVDSSYLADIVPGMVILGLFMGLAIPSSASAALHEVDTQNSSLAAAVQNVMQQVGAALGIAVLVQLALRRSASAIAGGTAPELAATNGFSLAFVIGGCLMLTSAILVAVLLGNPAATDWRGGGSPTQQPTPSDATGT